MCVNLILSILKYLYLVKVKRKKNENKKGMCFTFLRTLDQLTIDNSIMDEVRDHQTNLAISSYDYQKEYVMVRHD